MCLLCPPDFATHATILIEVFPQSYQANEGNGTFKLSPGRLEDSSFPLYYTGLSERCIKTINTYKFEQVLFREQE